MAETIQAMWSALDSRALGAIKIGVATLGAAVLMWDAAARRRSTRDRHARLRDGLLGVIGILAFVCWWNLGRFHIGAAYLQLNDQFHYYLGSKYEIELGYTRLYECTAVADDQDGFRPAVQRRWIRNLRTNVLERGSATLGNAASCTQHFTPERWDAFKHDVAWFRSRMTPDAWDRLQTDHGYNATPAWSVLGHWLSSTGPASDRQILLLALIDPALIALMWAAVWWAFGWRAMCVALLWWGTNYPARYAWTGGSFLRADWLAVTVFGVCLVRRRKYAQAGAALGYAALLRIFPVFVLSGLAIKAVATMWRSRSFRPPAEYLQLAAGALAATAVLVLLSITVAGGLTAGLSQWQQFVDNSRKHYSTPALNNVGLRVLASYGPESRFARLSEFWVDAPLDSWMTARRQTFGEREPFYVLAVAAFMVPFACAVLARDEAWIALALGVALLPIAVELTCYYYSILLVVGLLWTERPSIGVGLAAAAALSNVPAALFKWDDDVYAAVTTIIVSFVIVVTVTMAFGRGRVATSSDRLSYSS